MSIKRQRRRKRGAVDLPGRLQMVCSVPDTASAENQHSASNNLMQAHAHILSHSSDMNMTLRIPAMQGLGRLCSGRCRGRGGSGLYT